MPEKNVEILNVSIYEPLFNELIAKDEQNIHKLCTNIIKSSFEYFLSDDLEIMKDPRVSTLKRSIEAYIKEPTITIDTMMNILFQFIVNLIDAWKVQWLNLYTSNEYKTYNVILSWISLEYFNVLKKWADDQSLSDNIFINSLLVSAREHIAKIYNQETPEEERELLKDLFFPAVVDVWFKIIESFEWFDSNLLVEIEKEIQERQEKNTQE